MSTSAEARPFFLNEKGSNDRPFKTDACFTAAKPHNLATDAPNPPVDHALCCPKCFDDGQTTIVSATLVPAIRAKVANETEAIVSLCIQNAPLLATPHHG